MSIKRVCLVVALLILAVSTQIGVANCRVLRPTTDETVTGCDQVVDEVNQSNGAINSLFSANNSSITGRSSVRSLMFRLASGPSKKGPGH